MWKLEIRLDFSNLSIPIKGPNTDYLFIINCKHNLISHKIGHYIHCVEDILFCIISVIMYACVRLDHEELPSVIPEITWIMCALRFKTPIRLEHLHLQTEYCIRIVPLIISLCPKKVLIQNAFPIWAIKGGIHHHKHILKLPTTGQIVKAQAGIALL